MIFFTIYIFYINAILGPTVLALMYLYFRCDSVSRCGSAFSITALGIVLLSLRTAAAFWDDATTTIRTHNEDTRPRQSFFRWMWVVSQTWQSTYWYWDWNDLWHRRQLNSVCGISIDMLPINTGAILNSRTVITSANALEPFMTRQRDLRIWALGNTQQPIATGGKSNDVFLQAWRYRVWRVRRLFPRSNNPEHFHGARGGHQPRHDVVIIHTMDQIYVWSWPFQPVWTHAAYKAYLVRKDRPLQKYFRMTGTGYMSLEHVRENYKIVYNIMEKSDILDCSIYLPKWWGKFICFRNRWNLSAVANGGPLYTGTGTFLQHEDGFRLVGLGCFEIRYNEDRIMVFTDLRYYMDMINMFANITPLEYYEYAYPEWSWMPTWGIIQEVFGWPGAWFNYPSLYPRTEYFWPLGRK